MVIKEGAVWEINNLNKQLESLANDNN
jgi:hypothetical protein